MLIMIGKWTSVLCILFMLGITVLPGFGQAPVPQPGQQPKPGAQPGGTPQAQAGQAQKSAPIEPKTPAAEYAIALISTLGILVIVCMPSRKR